MERLSGEHELQASTQPWFSGKTGTILLLRVNRRAMSSPTLGADQPESVMEHLVDVLGFGEIVTTGRHPKRDWILGDREIVDNDTALTGQMGWLRSGERASSRYNFDRRTWEDIVETTDVSARAPFVFDRNSRILGVLRHPTFREGSIANVFETLLTRGEQRQQWPSTEWAVEPILDEVDFIRWIRSVESVHRITLMAKVPNPDALEEFGPIWEDLQRRRARSIKEITEALDPDEGLAELEEDQRIRAYRAMGKSGFGYIAADGKRGGRHKRYDQRNHAAREGTGELPPNWREATRIILDVVRAGWLGL